MGSSFCVSVTFLDPAFHGRGDGGEPEWPPSPLRLFQAVVAAAAARWRGPPFA
ncbi:MAG: type I-U CRISPR-associated protein Cas5/Cas6, partial [Gemmataceae bacterium]|nr:type I-U CRISPR-associated protein Cas5/Cas6 [Gemmataceae bacterium]